MMSKVIFRGMMPESVSSFGLHREIELPCLRSVRRKVAAECAECVQDGSDWVAYVWAHADTASRWLK